MLLILFELSSGFFGLKDVGPPTWDDDDPCKCVFSLTLSVKSSMMLILSSFRVCEAFRLACKTLIFSLTLENLTLKGAPWLMTSPSFVGFNLRTLKKKLVKTS